MDSDGKSQCRKDIEENLEKIFENGKSCLANHSKLQVLEKSYDQIWCVGDHQCDSCILVDKNECHKNQMYQEYRAEYEIELTVRMPNKDSDPDRIISTLDNIFEICNQPTWCADRYIIAPDPWHVCKPQNQIPRIPKISRENNFTQNNHPEFFESETCEDHEYHDCKACALDLRSGNCDLGQNLICETHRIVEKIIFINQKKYLIYKYILRKLFRITPF